MHGLNSSSYNTAFGYEALTTHTHGDWNVAIGNGALLTDVSGERNTAVGNEALTTHTHGDNNVAIGNSALFSDVSGVANTAVGNEALRLHKYGNWNVAIGYQALLSDVSGVWNTAVGNSALQAHKYGNNNVAIGNSALYSDVSGENNVAVGKQALQAHKYGNNNVAIGNSALFSDVSGENNVAIGYKAHYTKTDMDNTIVINATGNDLYPHDPSSCYIAPIRQASNTNALYYDDTTKEVTYGGGVPAGSIMPFAGPSGNIPNGWLLCDGSSFVEATYPQLYATLGTTSLPDLRGRGIYGFSDEIIPSTTARYDAAMGSGKWWTSGVVGTSTIPETALPNHTHTITDPGHIHIITDPGHNHNITDPGHVHSITDPGHVHNQGKGYNADYPSNSNYFGAEFGDNNNVTNSSTTGISISPAATGISIDSDTTGITINIATTGITAEPYGDGGQYPGAFLCLNFIIRAF